MSIWVRALVLLLIPLAAHGQTHEASRHEHGTHPECPLPKTAHDVLVCARENHPDVLRSALQSANAKAQPDAVSQFPNPGLQVQSVFGSLNNESQMQTQISLTQQLGLGGERSAKRQAAEARAEVADGKLNISKADITVITASHLHRLRQLIREKAIVQETLETYRKLIRQYRGRPVLSPEQQVSASTLEMAEADYIIRQSALSDEERRIGHFFHVATGHSLEELAKVLPGPPKPWPKLSPDAKVSRASPEVHRLVKEKDVALGELSLARANSWPDVRLGPMMMFDQEGGRKRTFVGFELDLPIPLFNLNGAGRAAANVEVSTAERAIAIQRTEEAHERNELILTYDSAVRSLEQSPAVEKVNERHRTMEKLFLRGVVPGSLIIEAHRQLLELEKSRHEREQVAIRSLWTVYRIDGTILEARL